MPGGWSFAGSCATGKISRGGTRFALAPYRGIAVTLAFGPSDSEGSPFVVGMATGHGDIGGTLNDRLPFPSYGSVPCIDAGDRPIACGGKVLVYLLIINAGMPVNFPSSPRLVVNGATPFPRGTRCRSNTLVPDTYVAQGAAYIARPPEVAPTKKTLVFEPTNAPQSYGAGGHVVTFAITCAALSS